MKGGEMFDLLVEEGAYSEPDSYQMKPRWARFLVLFAGPAFNYILAAALFFGMFLFWPGGNIRIKEVIENQPAAAAGLMHGDLIRKVNSYELTSIDQFYKYIGLGEELVFSVERDPLQTKKHNALRSRRLLRSGATLIEALPDGTVDEKTKKLFATGNVDDLLTHLKSLRSLSCRRRLRSEKPNCVF